MEPNNEQKQQTVTTEKPPETEINELLKGYTKKMTIEEQPEEKEPPKKKRGRPKKQEEQEIKDSSLISGALFLLLIDLAIPSLMCFVNNQFSKDKMKAKALKLTKEQKEELSPIADEAVKQLMLKASPLTVLVVSLVGIYGLNFFMLKSE